VADLSNTTLCPNISYTFADPYAPTTTFTSVQKLTSVTANTWTEITDFTGHFEVTDRFRVEARIVDTSADLIGARLYAKNGATELTLWTADYTDSSEQKVVCEFTLPTKGAWLVFMAGLDRSGRIRRKQLTAGGGASSVTINIKQNNTETSAPSFDPPGIGFRSSQFPVSVTLATTTAGAQIKYSIVDLGAAVGAFTNVAATSATVVVGRNKRLYAKADVGGSNESILLYHEYYIEVDEYYAPGTQPP